MGAEQFESIAKGATIEEAFQKARDEAFYEYGHRGYTGTIAEKQEFRVFTVPENVLPRTFARWVSEPTQYVDEIPHKLLDYVNQAADIYDDKWGPAVAIKLEEGEWLFCGWASS